MSRMESPVKSSILIERSGRSDLRRNLLGSRVAERIDPLISKVIKDFKALDVLPVPFIYGEEKEIHLLTETGEITESPEDARYALACEITETIGKNIAGNEVSGFKTLKQLGVPVPEIKGNLSFLLGERSAMIMEFIPGTTFHRNRLDTVLEDNFDTGVEQLKEELCLALRTDEPEVLDRVTQAQLNVEAIIGLERTPFYIRDLQIQISEETGRAVIIDPTISAKTAYPEEYGQTTIYIAALNEALTQIIEGLVES